MSHNSSEDGVQTPETVTESIKSLQLNDKKTVDSAEKTTQKVTPALEHPSFFVWCLHCAVLIRIDFPVGHRIENIFSVEPGNVCLNCLELQEKGKKKSQNITEPRSQLLNQIEKEIYISPQCVKQCSAFDKASSLTQNIFCELQAFVHGSYMLCHTPIKRLHNLCDDKCMLRTVVTDRSRKENYENFMVAGFM
ncbi:hypothetical protein Golomagni_05438 [Golovinomyces magnicellulatus]|nr:hypothetical protein Golomagni_05438 [Golovinomyces magnicellulatus]